MLAISWTTWPWISGTRMTRISDRPSRNMIRTIRLPSVRRTPHLLEASDSRRQHVGDREADHERHQDALNQAEDDSDQQTEADPEQRSDDPRVHGVRSVPKMMRPQRSR